MKQQKPECSEKNIFKVLKEKNKPQQRIVFQAHSYSSKKWAKQNPSKKHKD